MRSLRKLKYFKLRFGIYVTLILLLIFFVLTIQMMLFSAGNSGFPQPIISAELIKHEEYNLVELRLDLNSAASLNQYFNIEFRKENLVVYLENDQGILVNVTNAPVFSDPRRKDVLKFGQNEKVKQSYQLYYEPSPNKKMFAVKLLEKRNIKSDVRLCIRNFFENPSIDTIVKTWRYKSLRPLGKYGFIVMISEDDTTMKVEEINGL